MIKCVLCVEPCLNLNVNTTQKIYRNCLILNTSSKDISLQSKCVYCSIVNSVDRKLVQSKHNPYVLLLRFRKRSMPCYSFLQILRSLVEMFLQ